MRAFKPILLVAVVALLIADVSWHAWIWRSEAPYRAKFKFGYFDTNGVACVYIADSKTGKWLLADWDFGDGESPGEVSYYFQGTNLLDIYLKKDQPPRSRFIFHGPGRSEVTWLDKGAGSFTERIFYDTNGDFSKHEVWYSNAWLIVDRRDEKNGVIINGQWRHLALDTNHSWTIQTTSTNHF